MANWVRDYLEQNPEVASREVFKRARHALHVRQLHGVVEAHFTGFPCHWLDEANEWRPIDTALTADARTGLYGAPGVPVRIGTDGLVTVEGGYSQQTTRVGLLSLSTRTFSVIKSLPAGLLAGDCLIRETSLYRHILRLTENGVREELTLLSKPNIQAEASDWLVLETALSGVSFADGWLDEFDVAGMHFRVPAVRDANRVDAPSRRYARTVGGVQRLYTGVPVSWLANATYPVTVDPDFAGNSADGRIFGTSTTYATARSTASGVSSTGTDGRIGQTVDNYDVRRSYFKFVTSSIGVGNVVTQVNLKLAFDVDISDTDFDIQIVKCDWSGTDPLTDANKDTAFDNALSSALDDAILRNTAGISLNTLYTSGNLNTGWVNRSGATYYAARSSRDSSATTPTGSEAIDPCFAEHGTAGLRPVLTVLYSATPMRTLMGVGI